MSESDASPPGSVDPWPSRLRRWWDILVGTHHARRTVCYRKLLRPLTPVIAVDRHDLRILVETRDDTIGRRLFEDGDWQRADLLEALERIPARGDVIVDVGANVGPTTLYAMRSGRFGRAVAIEPHPELLPLLRANLALNGFDDRVEVVAEAVGRRRGRVELEGAAPDPRTGHLNLGDSRARTGEAPPDPTRPRFTVDCAPLDELLALRGIAPEEVGLVWMDIQGGEAAGLAGAGALLDAGVPFVCEFSPALLRASGGYEEFLALAERFGSVRILGEDREYRPAGLPVLADERPGDVILDLLLLPQPRPRAASARPAGGGTSRETGPRAAAP